MGDDKTYQKLLDIREKRGSGFVLLLDPDKLPITQAEGKVEVAIASGVDAFFIGGSFLIEETFNALVQAVKQVACESPVIIFPGSLHQISPYADALLFLCLISGRNPEHLIGNQAIAAPLLWKLKLEAISCGYMLIESGMMTSAEYISNSRPIPRTKPGIALAHALAAQYMGMKTVYLEAGSGAKYSVPEEMISMVSKHMHIPLLVGGGIRTPKEAQAKVKAGADFVVVGNFFETDGSYAVMKEFSRAIHKK